MDSSRSRVQEIAIAGHIIQEVPRRTKAHLIKRKATDDIDRPVGRFVPGFDIVKKLVIEELESLVTKLHGNRASVPSDLRPRLQF